MSSRSPESSQELDYPPVRVNQSLASLDLNALIMRSKAREHQEESTSLEDSSYEVVGLTDSVYTTSDDEGHTASVASTTPDDVSNFSDEDDDDFEHGYIDDASPQIELPAAEPLDNHVLSAGEDSMLTETPYMEQSARTRLIRLHEEPSVEEGYLDGAEVVNVFDVPKDDDSLLSRYGCSEVRFAVRALLSQHFLVVEGSFRVLYIGNLDDWVEDEIHSRLGTAVYASQSSSRSIMVGGQMKPLGPVLESDHCKSIKVLDKDDKPSQILLTLDRTQLTLDVERTHHNVPSVSLPDVVVFWFPATARQDSLVEKYSLVRKAFGRYQIPCLDIALAHPFGNYTVGSTSDSKSLRLSIEGRKDQASTFEHQETIPVNFKTFLDLDPLQLNRHLAALSPRGRASSKETADSREWNLNSLLPHPFKRIQASTPFSWTASTKLILTFVALTGMVAAYLLSAAHMPANYLASKQGVESSLVTSVSLCSSTPASTKVTSQSAVFITPSAAVKITPRDLTVVPPPQQPSQRREKQNEEKLGGFEIQATGEHQFVLSPAKDFFSRKRKPQLQIQVSRNAKSVPIHYVRTAGGVYIVDLEQEYPEGPFNVSIATHTKPLMQQSFEVSLGHNKSRAVLLFDLLKRDVTTTQRSLWELSSSLGQRIQATLAQMEGDPLWEEIYHSRQTLAAHLRDAKKEARRRLSTRSTSFREATGQTWMGIRKATAPMRTSQAALRARNNAFRIRCSLERAVGLSSKGPGGRRSRSCDKVGW